ncbi:hypothetical protein PV325_007425 [Microctonus aethiopoides]|nr:hypothetical protein PV325_007425 [Microctonus aethiopoides]
MVGISDVMYPDVVYASTVRLLDRTLPSASDDESYVIDEKKAIENMQTAEIEVSVYIGANNMPISSVYGLVALFNRISVNKGIPGNLSITSTGEKLLCILVKYITPNRELFTELFELVNLDAIIVYHQNCMKCSSHLLKKRNVSSTNIVAISSDNASVTVGKHNSFVMRLKKVNSNLIVLNCICHTTALIASKACAQLPKHCTDFFHSVGTYFAVRKDSLNNITINSMVPDNTSPTLSIKVGDNCQKLLDTLDREIVLEIKSNFVLFYKTGTAENIERLPYCDKFFCDFKILKPEIASSKEERKKFNNLHDLCLKFNLVDLVNNVNQEWLDLLNIFNDENIQFLSSLTVENICIDQKAEPD